MPNVGSQGFLQIYVRPDGGKWRLSRETIDRMAGKYKITWNSDPYDSIRTQGMGGLYCIERIGANATDMDIPMYTTRNFDYPAATIKVRVN